MPTTRSTKVNATEKALVTQPLTTRVFGEKLEKTAIAEKNVRCREKTSVAEKTSVILNKKNRGWEKIIESLVLTSKIVKKTFVKIVRQSPLEIPNVVKKHSSLENCQKKKLVKQRSSKLKKSIEVEKVRRS